MVENDTMLTGTLGIQAYVCRRCLLGTGKTGIPLRVKKHSIKFLPNSLTLESTFWIQLKSMVSALPKQFLEHFEKR